MKLSKRLSAVAAMVTPGMVLADIGTDHAYIPIDLVERDVIPRAIAADVNPGPLKRAAEHIRAHGLADRISTRLCDGLAAFEAGEVQSIVIAGMGGALTTRILQDGEYLLGDDPCELSGEDCLHKGERGVGGACFRPGVLENGEECLRPGVLENGEECLRPGVRENEEDCLRPGVRENGKDCLRTGMHTAQEDCRQNLRKMPELILQPQSEISRVRLWLWQNGWEIVQEDMVFEEGKYYPMMKARHAETQRKAASAGFCPPFSGDEAGTKKMAAPVSEAAGKQVQSGYFQTGNSECQVLADADEMVCLNPSGNLADTGRKLCLEFGPKLLEEKHPVLRDYLQKEKAVQERILENLSRQKSPAAVSRAGEIREKLSLIDEALKVYRQL